MPEGCASIMEAMKSLCFGSAGRVATNQARFNYGQAAWKADTQGNRGARACRKVVFPKADKSVSPDEGR